MSRKMSIVDGNEAAAAVAYRLNEVIAIYPITPSSPMGEWSDQWNSERRKNIWGAIPDVIEMQSEGGRGRCVAWRVAGWGVGHHVYRIAGPAADDPEHV